MEIMLDGIISHLNILYIFLCNIVTYLVIKSIQKDPSTLWKRIISAVVAVVIGVIGVLWLNYDKEAIFCSFFVQFLMYDYVVKWFLNKYDITNKNDVVVGDKTNE